MMIILTDIDDTLMKTARKYKNGVEGLRVGALNLKGDPNSFIDKKREFLFESLLSNSIAIPVTARSRRTFANLKIDFKHHAVLNFGATIVDKDKNLDLLWHEKISDLSQNLNQHEIYKKLWQEVDLNGFEVKIALEDGIASYMNFRDEQKNFEKIMKLKLILETYLDNLNMKDSFYFYQTDRDLALIPLFIKKENGVQYILDNYYDQNDLLVGLGDHKNDLSFMKICDFIMIPTDSMLMKLINNL